MSTPVTIVSSNRTLIVSSFDEVPSISLKRPFVTMLPAFDMVERRQATAIIGLLIARGCVEICCVGPEAEDLHDAIDVIVESAGHIDLVTTWHTDFADACEYFLFGAAGGSGARLAVIASHPNLVALLKKEAGESTADG